VVRFFGTSSQKYAPEIEKRLRRYWKPSLGFSWRVDETYVKVKGKLAHPTSINTDKAQSYGAALKQLKSEGKCSPDIEHRQVK